MKSAIPIALSLLAVLVLGSCSVPGDARFDPYAEPGSELGSGLDFEDLDLHEKLSPDLLHAPAGPYRVGPGDVLDVEVAEILTTRALTTVMPDGMLYFDVADGIQVKGKTLKEISIMLGEELKGSYPDPVVTVNLAQPLSQRFWILGQVKKPGAYPIAKPTRLVEAVSLAGGLYSGENSNGDVQDTVDLARAILIRNGNLVPVDFQNLIEHGDMSQNVYVRPNDYLYLPSVQHRAVYVLGAVRSPGPIYFDNDPSVLSAVAMAGGPRDEAIVTKALIIRGSLTQPRIAVVNIHNIMRGYDRDARLRAGDIVWVPNTVWTNLKEYAQAALTTAAQAVAVQEGLAALGKDNGGAAVTISAGGGQ